MAQFDHRMEERGLIRGAAPQHVKLVEIFSRAIADVSLDASTQVEMSIHPTDLEASIVPSAVHRAVEELLQNAAVHAPGGRIRLRCQREEPDRILLEITDEGPGWEPEVRDVQDLIHRGRGIGLSFCELVAERHRGTIELFNCEDGGAGVRLELHELKVGSGDGTRS
jgi:signal transduction histidine kinase